MYDLIGTCNKIIILSIKNTELITINVAYNNLITFELLQTLRTFWKKMNTKNFVKNINDRV